MLHLVVDTYKNIFKYEMNEFIEPDKIKWFASFLEVSIKDVMESIYNENKKKYEELKQFIETYASNSDNFEEGYELTLKRKTKKKVFLEIKGNIFKREVNYDYSEIEDMAIALMLMFANIYQQILKVDKIKAKSFKKWAIEEIGTTLGSSFWHTLEICILD